MYRKKINELAVTLEKINYLYRTIRKSEQVPKKVELALLKKYVQDLYDGVVDLEMPTTTAEANPQKEAAKEQIVVTPPLVNEIKIPIETTTNQHVQVSETPELTISETLIDETEHIAATVNDNNAAAKDSGIFATLKDKVANLQEDVANLKENLNETYQNALHSIGGSHANKNDDTDKTPYKEVAPMFDDDDDDDNASSKTQILDDRQKYASGALNLSTALVDDNDDDETIALNIKDIAKPKETPPALIDVLGKGDSNRLEFPISFNQRHAFVNQLFLGDEAAYSRAINDLSTSKGYIEALTYVNLNLRYDFKWRDDEPAVKEFLEIIKHTFWG